MAAYAPPQGPAGTVNALNGQYFNAAGDPIGTYNTPGAYNPSAGAYNADLTPPKAPAPTIDHAAIANFDQGISNTQAAINRLANQQDTGLGTINQDAGHALQVLLGGYNNAKQSYDQNKQTTTGDYVTAKNTIGANAGSTLNGIQRLLGARGAGGGSAYTIGAPQAVARAATLSRNEAGNTFAGNNQSLDQGWGTYGINYNNEVNNVNGQADRSRKSLTDSIASAKASLLQTIAGLAGQRAQAAGGNAAGSAQPYLNQANSILDGINHFTTAPIAYNTQSYTAPSLSSYVTDPTKATYQGQAPSNDYFSPSVAALLKKQTAGV